MNIEERRVFDIVADGAKFSQMEVVSEWEGFLLISNGKDKVVLMDTTHGNHSPSAVFTRMVGGVVERRYIPIRGTSALVGALSRDTEVKKDITCQSSE